MWIINCLLLMMGAVSAVMGISFYARNRQASGKIRFYILFYGLCSALWCICYGIIGVNDNITQCEIVRKVGVVGINGFLVTELFLVSEMSGAAELSEKAKELEYAARDGEIDYIHENHDAMMEAYRNLAEAVS